MTVIALHIHSGYVLIVAAPWRMEISLHVFGVGLLLLLLALNLSITLVIRIWKLPARMRDYHLHRTRTKARLALMQGITAYFSGDTKRAEKLASQALKGKEEMAICLMLGALSAHESNQPDKRDRYLSQGRRSDIAVRTAMEGLGKRLGSEISGEDRAPHQVPDGTKGSE